MGRWGLRRISGEESWWLERDVLHLGSGMYIAGGFWHRGVCAFCKASCLEFAWREAMHVLRMEYTNERHGGARII
jgi:hypothetical protein